MSEDLLKPFPQGDVPAEPSGTNAPDNYLAEDHSGQASEGLARETTAEAESDGPADNERTVAENDAARREQEEIAAARVVDTKQPDPPDAVFPGKTAQNAPETVERKAAAEGALHGPADIERIVAEWNAATRALSEVISNSEKAVERKWHACMSTAILVHLFVPEEEREKLYQSRGLAPSRRKTPTNRGDPRIP